MAVSGGQLILKHASFQKDWHSSVNGETASTSCCNLTAGSHCHRQRTMLMEASPPRSDGTL